MSEANLKGMLGRHQILSREFSRLHSFRIWGLCDVTFVKLKWTTMILKFKNAHLIERTHAVVYFYFFFVPAEWSTRSFWWAAASPAGWMWTDRELDLTSSEERSNIMGQLKHIRLVHLLSEHITSSFQKSATNTKLLPKMRFNEWKRSFCLYNMYLDCNLLILFCLWLHKETDQQGQFY